jgi:signal transduction histidine kinase/ligand-binding sensor domain-containing protein
MPRGTEGRRPGAAVAAVALVLALAGTCGLAQQADVSLSQLGLERWTPESGLAGSWVTDIVEDRSGFLWVATGRGLSRFDGGAFRSFTAATEASLTSGATTALAVGADGRLWVGLQHGGVRVLERDALRESPLAGGLPDVPVSSLALDRDGALWIGTERGLWRAGPRGAGLVPLPGPARDGIVRQVLAGPDGAMWVRTRHHGLFRVESGRAEPFPDAPGCEGLALAFTPDGRPVTSCVEGIWDWRPNGAGWELVRPSPRVGRLLVDRAGGLWFESPEGLVRRSPDGRENLLAIASGLGDGRVTALRETAAGDVWVGTFSKGLTRLRRGAVRAVGPRQGIPIYETTGIAADARGDLWIGTSRSGLLRFSPGSEALRRWTPAEGLPSEKVWAVAPDPGRPGRVWIGTERGIATVEGSVVRRVERPGRTAEAVSLLFVDPASPGTVWAAGRGGGVDELCPAGVVHHGAGSGLGTGRIRVFLRESSGALLAAGDDGVFRLDGERWHAVSFGGGKARAVRALAEHPEGTLWIASAADGLDRWSAGHALRLGERDGLPFNHAFSIEIDPAGGLWLSGDEGLVRLGLDDVDRWAGGEQESVPIARLSARDGLRDVECNGWGRPASTRLPDGTLVYPTAGGLALLDPSRLPRPGLSPEEVYVDAAFTGERKLPPGGPYRLEPGERDLRVRFGAIEFDLPEAVLFRYRIEGFDKGWVAAQDGREASWAHVPPGAYRFRVQARLPGKEWVEAGATPAVVVVPKTFESPWFRAGAAILVLGTIVVAVARRFRVQARHAAEISASREGLRLLASALLRAQEEERARLARELHDDITQRLAGLAMLTGGYARAVQQGKGKDVSESLEEVGRELEKLARDSQAISRELHPSLLDRFGLDGALRAECATFGGRTGLRVVYESRLVPEDLAPEVGIVLYRIAQEALRNVVSHSGAEEAHVTLEGTDEGVELTVRDAGKGFDAGGGPEGGGLGLASMAERARLVGATLEVVSRPGAGTAIRVRVRRDGRPSGPPARA